MLCRSLLLCSLFSFADAVPEPDPIFATIDLNATYVSIKQIFARMNLSPKEMAVLIGGGHSSGQATLEGGTYHGNWVESATMMGNGYFQLLAGGHNWCAVKSSDNGNALFVAKGTQPYIAETEFSPLRKYHGQIPCIETDPKRTVFENLPYLPAEELMYQPGIWHKPAGAAAFLPVDFALNVANETYDHVLLWAADERLFFKDFQLAWAKLTENGQQLRCSSVNGPLDNPADFSYSKECAARFGDESSYQEMWSNIRSDIKVLFDSLPERCQSLRPTAHRTWDSKGSVCPSSVLRLGFHVSATYDPEALNAGGSNFATFTGPCAMYDGCAGCLQEPQLALQRIQQRYQHSNVSLADVTIFAAGLAAARLSELRLELMPFHPGRIDPPVLDEAACKVLADRLPSPAYQTTSKAGEQILAGMLDSDLKIPNEAKSSEMRSDSLIV